MMLVVKGMTLVVKTGDVLLITTIELDAIWTLSV